MNKFTVEFKNTKEVYVFTVDNNNEINEINEVMIGGKEKMSNYDTKSSSYNHSEWRTQTENIENFAWFLDEEESDFDLNWFNNECGVIFN